MLREIAAHTDGTYFPAADTQALASVYDSIALEWTVAEEHVELTALFAGRGAVLLLAGVRAVVLVDRAGGCSDGRPMAVGPSSPCWCCRSSSRRLRLAQPAAAQAGRAPLQRRA
jgi:hypothetical protein